MDTKPPAPSGPNPAESPIASPFPVAGAAGASRELTPADVKWSLPAVHPEGRKFVVIAGAITFLAFVWGGWLFWPLLALTVWVALFFRDPVRSIPQDDRLILAPADGLVTLIVEVPPPPELAGEGGLAEGRYTRVSIFMSVFDMHIQRMPIAGTIRRVAYIPGKFVNAALEKASEDNERQHFLIERGDGFRLGITQIAGMVAKRILSFVKQGDSLSAGERLGLIRFGSRVDVYLPAGTGARVALGQRCIAGETVVAVIGEPAPVTTVLR